MKTTTIILTLAVGLAMQAMAGPDGNNSPSASVNVRKNTLQQQVYQFLKPGPAEKYKIERVGKISSRPWAQTVGWQPVTPFVDERNTEAHFNLFWIGARPD